MFYQTAENNHGLPFDPFKACVVPRAIGWVSTTAADGSHNLAPYSQFTNVTFDPPTVIFSANEIVGTGRKDTVNNIEATGGFCWQLATYQLREAVNITAEAVGPGVDEFERAGLEKTWSRSLATPVPMVASSPVRFECKYLQTIRLPGNPPMGTVDLIIGRVVGVHIDDAVLTNGRIDVRKTNPIARLGYYEYASVNQSFEMIVPGDKSLLVGLEGKRHNLVINEREQKTKEAETAKL